MSSFLLPCTCGQETKVSIAQAGQSVRCACGAQLEVPTLRGLRELAPAPSRGEGPSGNARAWSNRHRVALLLVLVSLCGLAAGGYLAATLPAAVRRLTPQEIEAGFKSSSPDQVYNVYQELRQGLPPTPNESRSIDAERKATWWRITIALAVSGLGLVAAAGVLLSGRKSKR